MKVKKDQKNHLMKEKKETGNVNTRMIIEKGQHDYHDYQPALKNVKIRVKHLRKYLSTSKKSWRCTLK